MGGRIPWEGEARRGGSIRASGKKARRAAESSPGRKPWEIDLRIKARRATETQIAREDEPLAILKKRTQTTTLLSSVAPPGLWS